jgi:hypothetical protein
MMNQEFDLRGMAEAGHFLGWERHTVGQKIKRGLFHEGVHYVKTGKQHLFSSRALTEWLKTPLAKRKIKS